MNKVNSTNNCFVGIKKEIVNVVKKSIESLLSKLSVKYLGFDAISGGKKIAKYIKDLKKENSIDSSFNEKLNIESALDEARKSLKRLCECTNVVLIVDEIDRCDPKYSLKVLERVHHFSCGINKMKTIIACDEKLLKNSLIKFYGFNEEGLIGNDDYTELCLKKYFDIRLLVNEGNPNENFNERFDSYNKLFLSNKLTFCPDDDVKSFKKEMLSFIYNIRTINKIIEKAELIHKLIDAEGKCDDKCVQCAELLITAISVIYKNDKHAFDRIFGNIMDSNPLVTPDLCKEHNFAFVCDKFSNVIRSNVREGGKIISPQMYTPKQINVNDFWSCLYFLTLSSRNKMENIPSDAIVNTNSTFASTINDFKKYIEDFSYKAFLQIR